MEVPAGLFASLQESLKIEGMVVSVGFDDLLDVTLPINLVQLDALYVVTTPEDARTQAVCRKHGAIPVVTDTLTNGGSLVKGAGLTVGMLRCRYQGWRLALDADIALPPHFRRGLINHTKLDPQCLYGADRVDLIGPESWSRVSASQWGERDVVYTGLPIGARLISPTHGYVPCGYFQLWHAQSQRTYPSTAGGAGLDDVAFAIQWPESFRRLLPSFLVYHLCVAPPVVGENWDGIRRHPRVDEGRRS